MINQQGRPIEILLVEDNPGDVRLTIEAFKEAKVCNKLNVVEDGEEAISYLRNEGKYSNAPIPDLVLLDLNLPKKDGREVLSEIKNDSLLKKIPVIILTTSQAEEDVLKSYELNANCYVSKPVEFKQFLNVIRSVEDFWLSVVKLPSVN
jgi:CheY-like chemotaxis protein